MATNKAGKPTRNRKKMASRNIPKVLQRRPDAIAHNMSRSLIERMVEGAIDHNDLQNIQGGTTDEYYHLTSAEQTEVERAVPLTIVTQSDGADTNPVVLGTAAKGVSTKWMRQDAVISDQLPATTVLGDGATATTQSDGDGSTKVATTAYADGKVTDAIADGETSKAPTQNAVYDALALKANLASPALTGTPTAPTAADTSNDTTIATTKFVSDRIAKLDLWTYKGTFTPPANYPAANAGDTYVANGTGVVGGTGPTLESGDVLFCMTDSSAEGNHATVGTNWIVSQVNLQPELYALLSGAAFTGNVSITGGSLSMTGTDTHFLPPSLTTVEKEALVSPQPGWMVYDETLNELQIYANGTWTSIGGGGGSWPVAQGTHGFVVGTPLYLSASDTYAAAQADTEAHAELAGIVSIYIDAGNFMAQQSGPIELTTGEWDARTGETGGLEAGKVYFLDPDNAGKFINEDDIDGTTFADGEVERPALLARSTTQAIILPYRGNVVGGGTAHSSSFVAGDISSNILTVVHGQKTLRPKIMFFDADNKPVIPAYWSPTSGTNINSSDVYISDEVIDDEIGSDTWRVEVDSTGVARTDNLSDSTPEYTSLAGDAGTSEDRLRSDASLKTGIDVVQETDKNWSTSDTMSLTFAFIPSKIVIQASGRSQHDTSYQNGWSRCSCVVLITGVDTITSSMNSSGIYDNNGSFAVYEVDSDTTNILRIRGGSDGAQTGESLAVGAWDTATKTLTLTWTNSDTEDTATFVEMIATAYK